MQQFTITSNDAQQRLDRFLKKLFPQASKSLIYKLNRKGKIKVLLSDGKKSKQDNEYKLQVGEVVQVFLPDADIQELRKVPATCDATQVAGKKLGKGDIIFEDAALLVVNKDPGLNVHPWDHKTQELSLIEMTQDYLASQKLRSLTFSPALIHRIDRDTSGIVMIAKQKQVLTQLAADFKHHRKLKKTYVCIVLGRLSRREGTIKKSLERIYNAQKQAKVRVSDAGQEAVSHYKLLQEFEVDTPEWWQILSLVEVEIETGRMHQIRVHLAHIWNPILWDKSYGDRQRNAYFSKYFHASRQMLHAWKIEFFHPLRNKKMLLTARAKPDMQKFLETMTKKGDKIIQI